MLVMTKARSARTHASVDTHYSNSHGGHEDKNCAFDCDATIAARALVSSGRRGRVPKHQRHLTPVPLFECPPFRHALPVASPPSPLPKQACLHCPLHDASPPGASTRERWGWCATRWPYTSSLATRAAAFSFHRGKKFCLTAKPPASTMQMMPTVKYAPPRNPAR